MSEELVKSSGVELQPCSAKTDHENYRLTIGSKSILLRRNTEFGKYGKANKIASSEDKTFSYIPDCSDLPISPDADYVYILSLIHI